jgi:hypothetical protein
MRQRLEGFGALPFFQPLAGGSPQPSAKGQTLPAGLVDETVAVFIRNY